MEIVFRALFVYVFLWVITRAVGRSTLGELSTFQLLLYVTMGDLIQQGVTQQDYSVTGAVLGVSTFAVLTVAITVANRRWNAVRPITHGIPIVLLRDGQLDLDALRGEQLAVHDFFAAAREQGIKQLRDVELAVLEADGKISFFATQPGEQSGAPQPPSTG
jgi:uncharacterized membrane protein YcaP (DUF421 family)